MTAKFELDVLTRGKVTRKTVSVKANDTLWQKSGKHSIYDGWQVDDISCKEGDEYILFLNQTKPLRQKIIAEGGWKWRKQVRKDDKGIPKKDSSK